jgi:hypothetical protein
MLRFFSRWFNNTRHHLVNGKIIKEELTLLKTSNPNYGTLLPIEPTTDPTKEIKLFSFCPSARHSFGKKLDNLSEQHVNDNEPLISLPMRH